MGQSNFISREDLLEQLAERSALSKEVIEAEREQLAKRPPAKLLRHWFGTAAPSEPRSPEAKKLREFVRRRSVLFEWVYGRDHPIARDLMYVRLPSKEKRRLVSLLLTTARPRLPWLDSKTVHAMAFRPGAFGAKQKETPIGGGEPWGALYHRIGIPKGNGRRRVLTIPNPALMQVHRALLRIIGPGLEHSLNEAVFGVRREVKGPTFKNAAAHRESEYIASFDLKDFFPSVRIGDITRGLKRAARKGIPMVDPSALPEVLARSPQRRELKWTDDAMLLVARLCTHRSRLPQGAPLSPLLASVAFTRFDQRIIHRLRTLFGARNFVYTRYFDDITVSLSRAAATKHQLKDAQKALQKIEGCLVSALDGSSFALNPAKSRCARIRSSGAEKAGALAEVTGLLVRKGEVTLSRSAKRWIRETAHRLGRQSLVEAAREWGASNGRQAPEWRSVRLGHRWIPSSSFRRRCSAERLVVLMLQRTNPDLRIRLIHKDWYAWQARIQDGAKIRTRAAAREPLQALLAAHWRGQTSIRQATPDEVVFSHDGVDVCAVGSESQLKILHLTAQDAILVADYWHHVHGMLSYLKGCPMGPEFEGVHMWRTRLEEALRQANFGHVSIRSVEERPNAADGFIWTVDEALGRAVTEAFSRLCDFATSLGAQPPGAWSRLHGALSRRVQDEQGYSDWLCALSQLTVRSLPRLPSTVDCSREFPGEKFFDYVRLREDIAIGRLPADYRLVDQVEEALGLRDTRIEIPARFLRGQMQILEGLGAALAATPAAKAVVQPNRWATPLEKQVGTTVDRLGELLAELRSTPAKRRLLDKDSGTEFLKNRALLVASPSSTATSDESWRHLYAVGKILVLSTREVLEPGLCSEDVPAKPEGHPDQTRRNRVWKNIERLVPTVEMKLKIIPWLRNRDSHAATPEQRGAWLSLQRKVAEILGRSWKSSTREQTERCSAPDDLQLTGFEAFWLKAELLEALCAALEAALANRVWEQWGRPEQKGSRAPRF